jgi:hypothetical protein
MQEFAQVLRCEGDYWTIVFDGRTLRLRDTKGLRYVAVLLRQPGRRVAATELVTAARTSPYEDGSSRKPKEPAVRAAGRDRAAERARLAVTKGIKSTVTRIAAMHPGLGIHLAATIRCGYDCVYTPDPRSPIDWMS